MNTGLHRREKIIFRAIDVMDEVGVQGLSTKKIAQKEKIAESTIFKHFKSKTDILKAVLDFYAQYDSDIEASIKLKKINGLQALKFYLKSYLVYYENYPAITVITQSLEEMGYLEDLKVTIQSINAFRRNALLKIINEMLDSKVIPNSYNAETYVDAVYGTINSLIRRWRMEAFSFDLYAKCVEAVTLILRVENFSERGEENGEPI